MSVIVCTKYYIETIICLIEISEKQNIRVGDHPGYVGSLIFREWKDFPWFDMVLKNREILYNHHIFIYDLNKIEYTISENLREWRIRKSEKDTNGVSKIIRLGHDYMHPRDEKEGGRTFEYVVKDMKRIADNAYNFLRKHMEKFE